MHTRSLSTLLACLLAAATFASASGAGAASFVIDSASTGSVYDGILDGFPGLAVKDGTGDLTGNALAVALKGTVTEERGIAELPLASLAVLTAADVATATLTFNIDDVLSTFGPGTDFDSTAADTIIVFGYSGNGTIETTDFANVAGQPLGTVDTTPRGVITDVSLGLSGPEVFQVDVTARVKTLLQGGATHFGLVFTTDDDQSGTSLDNLGTTGGPAGAGGAALPFLTITTPSGAPPVLGKAALKCQKALAKRAQTFAAGVLKQVATCLDLVLTAASKGQAATAVTAKCHAAIDPATATSKLAAARTKALAGILKACTGVTPADLGSPCDGAAADLTVIAACTLDAYRNAAEASLRAAYASGCVVLTSVGLDGKFATICGAL